ncbi:MerR family transcriptional regulator [uncultured Cedecea sp.]|uniref:MerR family transcriptional regulator n=1 Tax=uncultured Cedecea sp. TaxID=988762 RepID=UPI002614B1FB|nr:MerR family transcriptional regulator [uncultured Cedecea sp.]
MYYSIGEFAKLCGINATTLRAWQRRYGLLKPQRSDGGHRLYSDDDIQQALNILDWIKKGVPVSKVKTLLDRPEEEFANQWIALQEKLLQQLTTGRIDAARHTIYDAGHEYPRVELVAQLLRPLRKKISANLATTVTLREILDGLIIAYTSFCIEGDKKAPGDNYLISSWYLTDACEVWLEALQRTGQNKRIDILPHLSNMLALDMFPEHHWILVTAEKLSPSQLTQIRQWQDSVKSLEIITL